MTQWGWRLYLAVRAADNTAANRTAWGEIFANNGSGESIENEKRMADSAIRLSTSGAEPAQVLVVSVLVKADMRTPLQTLIGGLSQSLWAVVSNPGGLFIASNVGAGGQVGQPFGLDEALAYLENQYGMVVIEGSG